LFRLWELLLSKLAEKGMRLQQALVLVQYLRQVDEVGLFPQLRKLQIKKSFKKSAELGQFYFHTA
jgi:spectrin alpha